MLAAPALAAPPPVNLRVEMRAVALDGQAAAAAPGDVVIGTRRSTPAANGSLVTQTASDADAAVEQVLVLNGASATLHLRRLRALPTGEWVFSSSGSASGAGAGQTRQWTDAGRGLRVLASWPGGPAPVTLDIAATGRRSARTRLRVPLGEWTGFARFGAETGTELQLRVSLAH